MWYKTEEALSLTSDFFLAEKTTQAILGSFTVTSSLQTFSWISTLMQWYDTLVTASASVFVKTTLLKLMTFCLDFFLFQVADFGLAKLTSDTNTHVSTRVMGTFG